MLAKYPVYEDKLHNADAEAAYQLILDCAQGIRSLKAEFKEAGQSKQSPIAPISPPPVG